MPKKMKITSATQQGQRVLVLMQEGQAFDVPGVLVGWTEKTISIFDGPLIKVYDPRAELLSWIKVEWERERDIHELAARCAVASWFNFEAKIQPPKVLNDKWFNKWCHYWNVCRTSYVDSRQELLDFLDCARMQLLAPDLNGDGAYQLVDRLSNEAKQYNWKVKDAKRICSRPASLVSKFAFSCRPTMFVPRDRLALKTLGERYGDCADDYAAYMRAFLCEEAKISVELLRRRITPERFSPHDVMPQRLFQMRAADWYHLLVSKKFSFGEEEEVRDCDWVGRTAGAIHLGRLQN